jgi:hypothetical protein
MAAMKTLCYHVPGWRAWANLMDTREGPVEEAHPETELLPKPPPVVEMAKTERVTVD